LRLLLLALLLQNAVALIEFYQSKLYDEYDFTKDVIIDNIFCDPGCRIYASVPASSVEIAKKLIVQADHQNETSLYDISTMTDGIQKGYFEVERGNQLVTIVNGNDEGVTAPIAVWVLRSDTSDIGCNPGAIGACTMILEAAQLNTAPSQIDKVTVMSALPFYIKTTTEGPMMTISKLAGFDVLQSVDDNCASVFEEIIDGDAFADVQAIVNSPLISFYFNNIDFLDTKVAISASLGNDKTLDFSRLSFASSPGFNGCDGKNRFRSSHYDDKSVFKYSKYNRQYDVDITSVLNTDAQHPVTIEDSTNDKTYPLSGSAADGTDSQSLQIANTGEIEISWTRKEHNPDQSFLIRLTPSNEQILGPDPTTTTTT
ncbi:hypothetical protein PMAYCL1PPCAC_21621, partial [Pristionchus mayeri]